MKYFTIFIALLAFFGFTSCSNQSTSHETIKIGINSWTGYDPFIVAQQAGIFKANGVDVKIQRYASTVDEIQALKDGTIHGGAFTLDEVFTLVESGVKGKIVLIIDYSMGGDMLIGQKYIKSVGDLVGKTVGYEGTVVGEFLLQRAMEDNLLKNGSINVVNVNADKWVSTFEAKKVDALVCFNPTSEILLKQHEGKLLYSSSNIPFEIIDVLFIRDELLNNSTQEVIQVLKSWFATLKYIESNLDESANIVAKVKDISPENFKNGLKGLKAPSHSVNITVMDPRSEKNIYKYSQKIVDFMLYKGLLSNRINTTQLFDDRLLSELKKQSMGH